MPEPGVNQPPRGWLLPWDAVVVIVLSCLFILPPGRLLCTQRPAAGSASWGSPSRLSPLPKLETPCLVLTLAGLAAPSMTPT